MNMFAKLFTLGLLVTTLPAYSHKGSKCHPCTEKEYVGQSAQTDTPTVLVAFSFLFTDDKTMIMQFITTAGNQHTVTGTWQHIGDNCFSFCGVESKSKGSANTPEWAQVKGQICFQTGCQTASITNLTFTDFTDPVAQTAVSSHAFANFTVYLLKC